MLLIQLSPSHSCKWEVCSSGGLAESQPISLPSLHGSESPSFPGIPPDNTVDNEFVVDVKPCEYRVVIGYLVDEFTPTWLTKCFIAESHIYTLFMGKVSTLSHLNQGVRITHFWTKQSKTLSIFYSHRLFHHTRTGCIL